MPSYFKISYTYFFKIHASRLSTGLVPLERVLTFTTAAYVLENVHTAQGTPALIHAVMDTSEAIKIGAGECSRGGKSASIEPHEKISAAGSRSDAIRQISEKKQG